MSGEMYVRGNGASTLKRRVSVFGLIFKLTLFSMLLGLHVVLQSQVKLLARDTGSLESQKMILAEELERLISENDKMLPYSQIKLYAQNNLDMKHIPSKMKSFTVIDRKGYFDSPAEYQLPRLFETNINLALIEKGETFMER
jgi:cell division protein FtsL